MRKPITPEEVDRLIDVAAQVYEVNVYDILTGCRRRNVVDAKKAFYHIIKHEYGYSEYFMTSLLPFKVDRTTIMYMSETADFLLSYDSDFALRYKTLYERFTKLKYTRQMPSNATDVDRKHKPLYAYYTDDMIVRLNIPAKEKLRYLSEDYKGFVKEMANNQATYYRITTDMGCSKKLIDLILSE